MTLQAEDLMVGDWVLAYGKKTQIVWTGNIYKAAVRGFPHEFCEDELEPIPLTLEILNTNFSSCPDWWFIGDSSVYFRIYKKEGKYLLCIRSKKVQELRMIITYLHELQHALKLCGIEKTIEL